MQRGMTPQGYQTPLSSVANIASAMMGAKQLGGLSQQEQDLAKQKEEQQRLEMSRALSSYRGDTPYQADTFGPEDQLPQGLMNQGTQQNRGALVEALAGSSNPQYQNIALEQMLKPQAQPEGFTLSPGQVRYGPSGEVLAQVEKPEEKPDKSKQFDQASKLRSSFEKQAGDFVKVRDAFGRIKASAQNPSAAGDLALIFNYMKVLDPGSTVREGEFATAQNATGVPEMVQNMYNRVMSGERLNDRQRLEFTDRADMLYQSQLKGLEGLEGQYKQLAELYDVDPAGVVVDYRIDYDGKPTAVVETPDMQAAKQRAAQEGYQNLGKWIDGQGYEVFDANGNLIGYYE